MKNLVTLFTIFLSISNSFAQEYPGGMITSITETALSGTASPNSDLKIRLVSVTWEQSTGSQFLDFDTKSNPSGVWSIDYKSKNNDPANLRKVETYLRNCTEVRIINNTTGKTSFVERKAWLNLLDDSAIPENSRKEIAVSCVNEQTFSGTATPNTIIVLWCWKYVKNEFGNNELWSLMRLMNTNPDGTWNWNYRREIDIEPYFKNWDNIELYCLNREYVLTQNDIKNKYCDPKTNPAYVQDITITGISEQAISGLGGKNTELMISGELHLDDQTYRFHKKLPIGADGTWNWNYRAVGIEPYLMNINPDSLQFVNEYNKLKYEFRENLLKSVAGNNVEHPFFVKTVDENQVVGKSTSEAKVMIQAMVSGKLISGETTASSGGTWAFNYKTLGLGDFLKNASGIVISHAWQHIELNEKAIEALKNGTYTGSQQVVATGNKLYVSPSVATSEISIQGTGGHTAQSIEVYSATGQRVSQTYDSNTVNISGLAPGTYIAKIRAGNSIQSCKFVKK